MNVNPPRYRRPDRRFEVFISSTFDDLKDMRVVLANATAACGHIPIGMELFSAGPRDVDHIKQCIAEADVFVILSGARYGSFVKVVGTHFLDYEYKIAQELGKPILPYLLVDDEYHEFRSSLKEGDAERTYDNELLAFRNKLKEDADGFGRLIEFFSRRSDRAEELVAKYQRTLLKMTGGLNSGGWVPGAQYDELHSRTALSLTVSRNPFFSDFVKRLDKFDTLSLRIADEVPDLKTAIARHLLEQYLGLLVSNGVTRFYFESGSSIAFLSKEFISYLHDEKWLQDAAHNILIHTNNIITYLDFELSERIRVELSPYGPPEKKYGATFGGLTSLMKLPPMKVREQLSARDSSRPRPERWQVEVNALSSWFRETYSKGLVFMAASGIETNPAHPYYGPHTGSYYNMLFKRAILQSHCPVMMVLDEAKLLSKPFDDERCFPVCDSMSSWKTRCEGAPLALAVPCRSDEAQTRVIDIVRAMGLSVIEARKEDSVHFVVASNPAFHAWSATGLRGVAEELPPNTGEASDGTRF